MKKFVLGIAIAMVLPAAAYAAEPVKKACCCDEKVEAPMPMDHAHGMDAPKN